MLDHHFGPLTTHVYFNDDGLFMITAVVAARSGKDSSGWDSSIDQTLFILNKNDDVIVKHVIGDGLNTVVHVSGDNKYVVLSTEEYGGSNQKAYIFNIEKNTTTIEDDLYFQSIPFTEGGSLISGEVSRYGSFNTSYVRYDLKTKERTSITAEAYLNSANLMYRIDYVYGEGNRAVFFDVDTLEEVEWIAGTPDHTRFYDTGVDGVAVAADMFIYRDGEAPAEIQTSNPYFYRTQYGASDYFFAPDRNGGFYFATPSWDDGGGALNHVSLDGLVTSVTIQTAPVYYERPGATRGQGIWYESEGFMFFGGSGNYYETAYVVQKSPIMTGITSLDFSLRGTPPRYTYDRSFWDEHFGAGSAGLNDVLILQMVTAMPATKNIKHYKPFWQKFVLAAEEQI